MKRLKLISVLPCVCSALILILGYALAAAESDTVNWPQFRGPDGNGLSSATQLPIQWNEQTNVRWKTAIHGRAWSSPVIWGNQIWVTTATEDGKQLSAVCVERTTGKILFDLLLFTVEAPPQVIKFNTYASPTPVIEEGRVYVTFGSLGTACIDTKTGKVLWQRTDIVCNHFRGPGSSPILYGKLLICNFDGSDRQFVMAFDKETGKTAWETRRSIDYKDLRADGNPEAEGDLRKAFSTVHVAVLDGSPCLVSQGAKALYGYQPDNGRELWRLEERTSHSASSRPVVRDGIIYCQTGWSTGELLAVRPGKLGETADANVADGNTNRQLQVLWQSKRNVPRKPGLLLVKDLIFTTVDDGGFTCCLEAKDGKEVWRERIGGNYSASPICTAGRIYIFSEEGKSFVIEASRTFKKLAENQLDEGCMASPAVSGNTLYLRTRTHLYAIEDKK